jgi:hypothetical protein
MMTLDRRSFNNTILLGLVSGCGVSLAELQKAEPNSTSAEFPLKKQIEDELIRTGIENAITKTLLPAASQKAYPGHFTASYNGEPWPREVTWPGLDSWESSGAYLLLGQEQLVLDSFEFIQASQRADGNIPIAIIPADSKPEGMDGGFKELRYPQDVYTYKPVPRKGQPSHSNMSERKWIGLFHHWQTKVNPLSVLGSISYILTGWDIFEHFHSQDWLIEKMKSLNLAGRYVLSRKSDNGLISGAGFYIESPPRNQWDGITQCYSIHVFRLLAKMHTNLGNNDEAGFWLKEADKLAEVFRGIFWKDDHFAEYVHPEHGVVDFHGLTDVNWAAVAFDVATTEQKKTVWPLMMKEKELWIGDMPTQLVSKPYAYRDWELIEPISFPRPREFHDVAAMGRVWYLETLACLKMGEIERLKESVRNVCKMGQKYDWYWYERYWPIIPKGEVYAGGPKGYCEYPAILVRTVLGNQEIFK